jgi:hypothetical protein
MSSGFKNHALFIRNGTVTRGRKLGMVPAGLDVRSSSFQSYPLKDRCLIKADAVPVLSSLIGLIVSVARFASFVRAGFVGARFEARAVPVNRQRLIVSYANLGDF